MILTLRKSFEPGPPLPGDSPICEAADGRFSWFLSPAATIGRSTGSNFDGGINKKVVCTKKSMKPKSLIFLSTPKAGILLSFDTISLTSFNINTSRGYVILDNDQCNTAYSIQLNLTNILKHVNGAIIRENINSTR